MTYTEEQAKADGTALALVEWKPGDTEWIQFTWQEEDGDEDAQWDGENIVGPTGYGERWWNDGSSTDAADVTVIEWAPLPLRGVRAVYPDIVRVSRYLVTEDGDSVFSCCNLGEFEYPLCEQLGTKRYTMHMNFVEIEE